MVGRPESGQKYKRDNLLGPEAAEACFQGTYKPVVHDAASERARGALRPSRYGAAARIVVLLARREDGYIGVGEEGTRGTPEDADLVTCESSRVTRES